MLEAAIERVTRALAAAADEVIPGLVAERRAMREELEGLRRGESRAVRPEVAKAAGPYHGSPGSPTRGRDRRG